MAADNPRILELRRRVQADPASVAFAQLAEECRRAGDADEAVGICRAGLAHHPGYLSARVTLGRALIEVGRLDEAAIELATVVQTAPTNLPAIRGLAEIHQQRGDMAQALAHYQRALQLAQFDPDLEDSVERLSQVVAPAPVLSPPSPVKVEELFDFDALLRQLGDTKPLRAPDRNLASAPAAPSPIDAVDLDLHAQDVFAEVERELRERAEQVRLKPDATFDQVRLKPDATSDLVRLEPDATYQSAEQLAAAEKAARAQLVARRQAAIVAELDEWLQAIAVDRRMHHRA